MGVWVFYNSTGGVRQLTACPKYGQSAAMLPKCFAPSGKCNEVDKVCPIKKQRKEKVKR